MRHCHVLRVFTRGSEGGNHLGVVMDVAGLSTEIMQATASDLGFSETVYVDLECDPPYCRIFTPTAELPFAGHPLVGAAWAIREFANSPTTQVSCGVGLIDITAHDTEASITRVGVQEVVDIDPAELKGLDLPEVRTACTVLMPIPYTVVQLTAPSDVSSYAPSETGLSEHPLGSMIAVWADNPNGGFRLRFFAPGHGIFEDPATGSAAVALAAVQRHLGNLAGSGEIEQGEELGLPSSITLDWDAQQTKVGGEVRYDETRQLEI